MNKYFKTILFTSFVFISVFNITNTSIASSSDNAGLIDTTIWYSKSSFAEGDTISIHTAVWNGEDYDINARVEFLDVNTILGTRNITISKNTLQDVSVSWKVTSGDHKISARIASADAIIDGNKSTITILNKEENAKDFFVPKKLVTKGDGTTEVIPTITDKVNQVLPQSVAVPVNNTANSIDSFRKDTANSLEGLKTEASEKLESFKKVSDPKADPKANSKTPTKVTTNNTEPSTMSGIDKPITYIEIFLLTIALFIFEHSIVFYVLLAFILFIILRFIYRKIRR